MSKLHVPTESLKIDSPVASEQGHDDLDYEADCSNKDHGQ